MKCSLRFWFLSTAFLLVFVMSLLFTYSHPSMAYLDPGSPESFHRVRLVPGYAGMQRLSQTRRLGEGCTCHRCTGDAGASEWFTSHYDSSISPVWTKENMELPLDVQRWWMVSEPLPGGPGSVDLKHSRWEGVPFSSSPPPPVHALLQSRPHPGPLATHSAARALEIVLGPCFPAVCLIHPEAALLLGRPRSLACSND